MQGERANLNYAIASLGHDDFQSDLEAGIHNPDSMIQSHELHSNSDEWSRLVTER